MPEPNAGLDYLWVQKGLIRCMVNKEPVINSSINISTKS